jgi:Zn-dependent protease
MSSLWSGDVVLRLVRWLYPFCNGFGLGVIAMLLHECGHLAASLVLGVRVKNVGMKWNKGLYMVREQGSARQNLLIAAAGPVVNLMLIATEPWIPLFSLANFCYALANMLPIDGSDGLRIASCWQQLRKDRVPGRSGWLVGVTFLTRNRPKVN